MLSLSGSMCCAQCAVCASGGAGGQRRVWNALSYVGTVSLGDGNLSAPLESSGVTIIYGPPLHETSLCSDCISVFSLVSLPFAFQKSGVSQAAM